MPGGVFIRGRHVGCGNLWNYRSLIRKLCWRLGHLCRAAPLPALTIEGQSRRL